jgi:DNA-binding transcriptional ArsR family regulator
MGLTKRDIYTDEQNKLALLAKAIGHPARIAILQNLLVRKTCICGDLVLEIGLSQATVSQHLKELKTAGLIKGTIDGPRMCYCIDLKKFEEAKRLISQLLSVEGSKFYCC